MFFILFAISLCALSALLYRKYTILARAGLNHAPPVPLLGDMTGVILQREHAVNLFKRIYESYPGDRFVGRYEFLNPIIVIKDPGILKKITVKDFEYFADRGESIDPKAEPLFGRSLVGLKGEEWRNMRSALSPAFTSAKIRMMVPFMVQVGKEMVESLKTKIKQSTDGYVELNAKDLAEHYASDVIASCAFGIDVNSQYENNEFYDMCREITTMSFVSTLKCFGYMFVPGLMRWLKLGLYTENLRSFYFSLVLGTIKQREEMNIHRPDMIHLLMQAKKGKLSHDIKTVKDEHAGFATVEESDIGRSQKKTVWSDMDLVAQAVIFLFTSFETISSSMSFLMYELAVNTECQERLVQEIRQNEERNNGKFDYNSVQQMTYLDMVVSELLRKWPGAPVVDRLCTRDYNLGKPNINATQDVIIRKGNSIQIPLWAYHHDPNYFPDPEKFDPERFSEENKNKIDPFVYIPFGLGPRNCIGSRFALCELKVMVYQVLLEVEVSPCEKTNIPIRLCAKDAFRMTPAGGNWLRFRVRR